MYKILIVDDETLEREGIRELLACTELNIEVVGEACNGKKALEMAQQIKPDIVVTDIRMPGISGIELAVHLKKQFPDIKIIFVTGYQDFEYAKSAISLGVCGYVLKPIDKEELFTVIKKAIDEFEYEQHNKEEKQTLTRQVEESLPLLQQQFVRNLLLGSGNLDDGLLTRLKEFRISFDVNTHHVAVISLDNYRIYEKKLSAEQKLKLTQSILYRFNDIAGSCLCSVVVQMEDNLFACLIPHTEKYTKQTMEAALVGVIKSIELNYGITATIGISENASSSRQLHQLYQQALAATRHKWYMGPGKVIWANGLPDVPQDIGMEQEVELRYADLQAGIMRFVLSGDEHGIGEYLEQYFDNLPARVKNSQKLIQNLCLRILEVGERLLAEKNECLSDVFGDRVAMLEELLSFETFIDVKSWIISKMKELTVYMHVRSTDRNSRVVKKIIDIINNRYFEELTVELLSQEVYLSPNYIRRIFKNETGQTILEYLTQVRMKKAAEMMRDPSLKISDICRKVGYGSVSYFGQIFKQYFGVSPKEYMESVKEL